MIKSIAKEMKSDYHMIIGINLMKIFATRTPCLIHLQNERLSAIRWSTVCWSVGCCGGVYLLFLS
jgi:hypothetical protein